MISAVVALLLSACVARCGAGRFALPVMGQLDVLGQVDVQETVCLEGFYCRNGYFYQSNGWYGESALVKIDPATGCAAQRAERAMRAVELTKMPNTVLTMCSDEVARIDNDKAVFAEGIAFHGNVIFQLTYQKSQAIKYRELPDNGGFEKLETLNYASREGWGLTSNGCGAPRAARAVAHAQCAAQIVAGHER